jgi:SNF2-related domain/Helicase conserved C-terminal domain
VVSLTLRRLLLDIAPGARVQIRDEEWLVRTNDPCDVGGRQLTCLGISELVRDREAIFLTAIDEVEVLDPAETELVADASPAFIASRLYLEARLRQTVPTTPEIAIANRGAMDTLPFQLTPTTRALEQLRPRFLIADAVGLGKTLEAGILVAELMRRGRGRRILVVTTKSMMQQFQMEFWTRFTIPLTRLDSAGVQRIRRQIPANHNPFHYYDKTIISIDTLKRDSEYRHFLETAYWDIIVIDEAHNVSFKGNRTLNHRLATLLSERSDALIMLTATPHSGDRESFASLMRMLDPTALPRKSDYTRGDVEHLFARRFKRDVRDEIRQEFPERRVFRFPCQATVAEERAFTALANLDLRIDRDRPAGTDMLFRTTLEKSLLSSPAACAQTLGERIKRLRAKDVAHPDIAPLTEFLAVVSAIQPSDVSKLDELVRRLKFDPVWRWDPTDAIDRLVVFTERIETLKFLQVELPRRLGLPANAVAVLHGQLPDAELTETVESFGRTASPLRLLIASDVASEGLNLHFQSHRLVHFDIPWSLMVFQQRNGRVDRYGQTSTPLIGYLCIQSSNERLGGDLRILDILIAKDEQAARNIGDPSIFMGLYDEELETHVVAKAIEDRESPETFEAALDGADAGLDWLDALMGAGRAKPPSPSASTRAPLSLFTSDYEYLRRGFEYLHSTGRYATAPQSDDRHKTVQIRPDEDLDHYLSDSLTDEMRPEDRVFALTSNAERVKEAIKEARNTEHWPQLQYLWPLHPILQWLDYKLLSAIGRHRAPVIRVRRGLGAGESLILISAVIPNRRGQIVLDQWFAVRMGEGGVIAMHTIEEVLSTTGLARDDIPNPRAHVDTAPLAALLPPALDQARKHMREQQREFSLVMGARATEELARLDQLRTQHHQQLELEFNRTASTVPPGFSASQKQRSTDLDALFAKYQAWVTETLEIEPQAHLTVAAVLTT